MALLSKGAWSIIKSKRSGDDEFGSPSGWPNSDCIKPGDHCDMPEATVNGSIIWITSSRGVGSSVASDSSMGGGLSQGDGVAIGTVRGGGDLKTPKGPYDISTSSDTDAFSHSSSICDKSVCVDLGGAEVMSH